MPADDTKLVVAPHNTHHTKPKSRVPPLHSTPLALHCTGVSNTYLISGLTTRCLDGGLIYVSSGHL